MIMMAGGSPPPAVYEHADGGAYRGEWLGPRKQGLGTYTYPSGGQYQGMWRDNLKEGYGVYTFPKVPVLISCRKKDSGKRHSCCRQGEDRMLKAVKPGHEEGQGSAAGHICGVCCSA